MEIVKKETRDNEDFYYMNINSFETIEQFKEIFDAVEKGGYVINRIRIDFIYDDSIVLPTKKYSKSSGFLDDLQKPEMQDEMQCMEYVVYRAEKENFVRKGCIYPQDGVISCLQFEKEKYEKTEKR